MADYVCPRCGSRDIKVDVHPFYGTHVSCNVCWEKGVLPDREIVERERVVAGLMRTVSSKYKRWGM